MRRFIKYALVLLALGVSGLPVRTAFATDPADMQTWYADDGTCSIFQVLLISDPHDPDNKVALVTFVGESVASSYAKWMQSDNTLTLSEFRTRPDDTFSGTFDGSSLKAVHSWPVKGQAAPRRESCTFTLG
jgi:hypothetical protein